MKRSKMLPVVLLIIALVIQPFYAFAGVKESVPNPYVQQYLEEKAKSKTTLETLVDPELEEKIIIATLNEYYNEDVKVANIIKKYQKDINLMDKVISLNKEDKINAMHVIKEIYPYVKDQAEQDVLIAYFKRYARDAKDTASIVYLNEFVPQLQSINRVNEKEDLLKRGPESVNIVDNSLTIATYPMLGIEHLIRLIGMTISII